MPHYQSLRLTSLAILIGYSLASASCVLAANAPEPKAANAPEAEKEQGQIPFEGLKTFAEVYGRIKQDYVNRSKTTS